MEDDSTMRTFWVACVVLAALPCSARADLRFDVPHARLGEIRSGIPVQHQFSFRNDGPGDIELLEARTTCGCIKPTFTQKVIAPGQQGVVPLAIQTLTQPAGPHTWQLTVVYREAGEVKQAPLQVSAVVITEIVVEPAALTIVASGEVNATLTVTDMRAQPTPIKSLESTAPWLRLRAEAPIRTDKGHVLYRIAVQVGEDCPAGRHDETIVLHSADPIYGQLRVPVVVSKRAAARVVATPADLELRTLARLVRLTDSQGQPVVVEMAAAENPAVKCQVVPEGVRVTLDRSALATPGAGETRLNIRLRAPTAETLRVLVRWDD